MKKRKNIDDALTVLSALGLPKAQQNDRSALCLLALLNVTPEKTWAQTENPLIGVTPIMDWARGHYRKKYAPNTRETVRRQTLHQFVDAGIVCYNPDNVRRPVNSPRAVYQIEPITLALLRTFGTPVWEMNLNGYLAERMTLSQRYARERSFNLVPVRLDAGKEILLSPGGHSELVKAIVEDFAPRFVPKRRTNLRGRHW